MKYEVRFHLLKGENYMKWQVKCYDKINKSKIVKYYSPQEYEFVLNDCKLVNNLNKAKKVFAAQKKDVSGWIECSEVIAIKSKTSKPELKRIKYNPIVDVHWRIDEEIADGKEFKRLVTNSNKVYIAV
jgi:hypothetical protein